MIESVFLMSHEPQKYNVLDRKKDSRGFVYTDKIEGSYGDNVYLKDSSVAFNPHIWLYATEPEDINAALRGQETAYTTVSVHLPVAKARQLRDALDEALKNHYYGDMSQGEYDYDPDWWGKEQNEKASSS